ncbi:unnamed protein product [Oikopleura dioica]|uniref:Phospholipase A2-like central domain-containing protein n=1 Tax=Oikopleura dioica TaxID=34765 RepID=E4XWI9_OIKDI|nr:unnamed protein product [Oikopleura dioica]
MRFFASGTVLSSLVAAQAQFSPEPRKYNQLVTMIKAVFPEFDENTYFNYGCNGQMNAPEVANPLAHSGFGAPVDELDKIFKEYRACGKCLREEVGEDCLPDNTRYNWTLSEDGELVSVNPVGTCRRNVFECDKRLAIKLAQGGTAIYDVKYDFFFTTVGFDFKDDFWCHPSDEVIEAREPACCQPESRDTAFMRYNKLSKQCCADGSIQKTCPGGEEPY